MSEINRIPFLDLVAPHQELRAELEGIFSSVLDCAGFVGGPMVEAFEREFASFCEVSDCIGVASGTDALRFALIAAGIAHGEIVVTAPNTFIATAEAISQAGAIPVFVDVDERTYNMDPAKLQQYFEYGCFRRNNHLVDRRLGRPVTAIVPVHLYGQTADMDPILQLAQSFGLQVIEDACQAHGAEYFSRREGRWRKAGSMGRAAAFSFYPGKNLGACGEAGAVTTNDSEMARAVRMLRDHGQAQKYYHDIEGYNGRLDALQAGILKVKLGRLTQWNEQRRMNAQRYNELFDGAIAVGTPHEPTWARAVYHLYVVRIANRAEVQRQLTDEGIGTGIHYPVPLHLQKAYKASGYLTGDFPVAEHVCSQILSLPLFPGLTNAQRRHVAERLLAFAQLGSTYVLEVGAGGE